MKILIYDDNKKDVICIKNLIETFFSNKSMKYEIIECENTSFLFDHVKNCDLIFLDMEINHENGIDIGKEIRKINSDSRIIIVSNYSKYLIDGYKIQADRYFLKPIKQEEFNIEFENVIGRYLRDYKGIFDEKIGKNKIYFKDILYIEFIERKTKIHLLNSDEMITPYSLKYWEEKLSDDFFGKPYKSFLVNLKYVSGFHRNDIVLTSNEIIPLSRYYKQSFNTAYLSYLQRGL